MKLSIKETKHYTSCIVQTRSGETCISAETYISAIL